MGGALGGHSLGLPGPSIHQAPPADLGCPASPAPGTSAPAIDCGGKGLMFELSCFTLRFLSRFLGVVNCFCLYFCRLSGNMLISRLIHNFSPISAYSGGFMLVDL